MEVSTLSFIKPRDKKISIKSVKVEKIRKNMDNFFLEDPKFSIKIVLLGVAIISATCIYLS